MSHNRPISERLSARVWRYPLSPDQWSGIAFGSLVAGAALLACGRTRVGGSLVQLGAVLDGVDGGVARLQGTASPRGALLDLTLDRIGDVAVHSGLALAAGGTTVDWLLSSAATNGAVVASVVKERANAEGSAVIALEEADDPSRPPITLPTLADRDGRLLAAAIGGVIRSPRASLVWLALVSNLRLVRRLRSARRLMQTPASPTA